VNRDVAFTSRRKNPFVRLGKIVTRNSAEANGKVPNRAGARPRFTVVPRDARSVGDNYLPSILSRDLPEKSSI